MKSAILTLCAVLALAATSHATAGDDLTTVDGVLATELGGFNTAKSDKQAAIESKRSDVVAKQAELQTAQDTFLDLQKDYIEKYDYHQLSLQNVTDKTAVYDAAQLALDNANAQKDDCPAGQEATPGCLTCTDPDYYCVFPDVNGSPMNRKCDCDQYRAYLINQYTTERDHTQSVMDSLQEGNNPIDEYEQQATALATLTALKAELQGKLDAIDAQQNDHDAFIAALEEVKNIALNEKIQAEDERDMRDSIQAAAESAKTAKQGEVDTLGGELKTLVSELKTLQSEYETLQNEHFDTLKTYREKIRELISTLDSQEVSAKTAIYFEKGGYAEIPSVNLRNSFTIEFWAYFDPNSNNRLQLPVISQARIPGGDDTKFVFQIKLRGGPREKELEGNGHYDYYFWDARMGSPESPGYAVRLWGNHMNHNGWHHVAMTVASNADPASSTATLYVDGVENYQKSLSGSRWSSPENIMINKIKDSHGTRFGNGAFDELRIWSVARSEAEIQASMHGIVDARTEPLRSYYRFDDAEDDSTNHYRPNVLRDLTPNRLDGHYFEPAGLEGSAVQYIRSTAFEPHGANFVNTDYAVYLDSSADRPNYISLPARDFSDSFTIEAWFNVRASDDLTRLPKVSQAVTEGSRREEFVFTLEMVDNSGDGSSYVWRFKMGECPNSGATGCGYALELESDAVAAGSLGWMHVAVSVTNNEFADIFVNGECSSGGCHVRMDPAAVNAVNSVAPTRLTSSEPILIGKLVDDNGFHGMNAAVDEIRFHNRGRTKEQIQAFRERTLPKSLIEAVLADRVVEAYYMCNEAQGVADMYDAVVRDATDASDVPQTGTLVGPRLRLAVGAF